MIQPGRYRGRPVSAVLGFTQGGKPQIAVEFDFTDPPGHRMVWYGYFTEKTWERSEDALRYCGWTGYDINDFAYGNPLPVGFEKEVELVVEEELDMDGKLRSKIAWVNRGDGIALKNVMTTAQAVDFAKEMKAKMMLRAKSSGAKPAASAPPAAVADDLIPF